jgi:3-dehydroquinate synthase
MVHATALIVFAASVGRLNALVASVGGHAAHGAARPSWARGGPLKALASREETAAPARPAADPGADDASLFEGFVGDCEAAVGDKRLIDEVVARFAYSGALQFEHETTTRYDGQGAVKRGLSRLFFEGDAAGFDWAGVRTHAGEDRTVSARLTATAESGAVAAELDVAAAFDGAGGVASLFVSPLDAPSRAWLARTVEGVQVGQDGGPKWETYDGRVRQQIWQSPDCFAPGNPFLAEKLELTTGRLITIVDETVWGLYREKIEAWAESVDLVLDPIVAPGNEDEKSMENMIFMLDEIARVDPLRRAEPILAVGGGVLTDTAGFACALWRRGVPWARMPTTLLGMVDASVGIKVAVNYKRKNGVGHFFSPSHTFVDTSFLPTVSYPDVVSGCGEIMKAALVHDGTLFDLMEAHGARLIDKKFVDDPVADDVIKRSVDTMLECIGPDLWEESLLRPMDFGHSFSRTLETTEAFKLRHGEAVAIDCIMNSMIANDKGLLSDADADRVLDLYKTLGLPCSIEGITAETYKRAAREITVHRDGILRAPLPNGIGKCAYTDEMTDDEIERAFAKLSKFIDAHPETKWDPSKSFAADRES